ncbi:MAG: hypothetical protein ACPG4T_08305, partial [Nannocystaceae bacterium]
AGKSRLYVLAKLAVQAASGYTGSDGSARDTCSYKQAWYTLLVDCTQWFDDHNNIGDESGQDACTGEIVPE